jgi:hypothetical protein
MIVLNGADGLNDIAGKVMAQGATGLSLARTLIARATGGPAASTNGSASGSVGR